MTKIESNINGKLKSLSLEKDGTYTIELFSNEGCVHIYKNLKNPNPQLNYKVDDTIGESEELNYSVKYSLIIKSDYGFELQEGKELGFTLKADK